MVNRMCLFNSIRPVSRQHMAQNQTCTKEIQGTKGWESTVQSHVTGTTATAYGTKRCVVKFTLARFKILD